MTAFHDLAELVTFRPLEHPVPSHNATRSPFTAPWRSTVKLLAVELRAHTTDRAVCEVDFREQDLRLDGLPRSDRTPASPAIVLSFHATALAGNPQLRYEVARYNRWEDNMRAVALGLQALRAVDRYGITRRGEQYAGWRQIEGGAGEGNPGRGRTLILQAGSVAEALKRAHPDHGGDAADFRDVIAARGAA